MSKIIEQEQMVEELTEVLTKLQSMEVCYSWHDVKLVMPELNNIKDGIRDLVNKIQTEH